MKRTNKDIEDDIKVMMGVKKAKVEITDDEYIEKLREIILLTMVIKKARDKEVSALSLFEFVKTMNETPLCPKKQSDYAVEKLGAVLNCYEGQNLAELSPFFAEKAKGKIEEAAAKSIHKLVKIPEKDSKDIKTLFYVLETIEHGLVSIEGNYYITITPYMSFIKEFRTACQYNSLGYCGFKTEKCDDLFADLRDSIADKLSTSGIPCSFIYPNNPLRVVENTDDDDDEEDDDLHYTELQRTVIRCFNDVDKDIADQINSILALLATKHNLTLNLDEVIDCDFFDNEIYVPEILTVFFSDIWAFLTLKSDLGEKETKENLMMDAIRDNYLKDRIHLA